MLLTCFPDFRLRLCVVDVPTIPGEEKIDTVNSGDSNMQGIIERLFGYTTFLDESFGQTYHFVVQWKNFNSRQFSEPSSSCGVIASSRFLYNDFRYA